MSWKDREFYTDKKGKRIKEFSVLKVFHFIGARRKKNYMYKWVVRQPDGTWKALHLSDLSGSGYWLRAVADGNGKINDSEIVQEIYDSEERR